MPHRFPKLSPPDTPPRRTMAKAMPAPGLRWLDALWLGAVVLILRQL